MISCGMLVLLICVHARDNLVVVFCLNYFIFLFQYGWISGSEAGGGCEVCRRYHLVHRLVSSMLLSLLFGESPIHTLQWKRLVGWISGRLYGHHHGVHLQTCGFPFSFPLAQFPVHVFISQTSFVCLGLSVVEGTAVMVVITVRYRE